LMQNALPHSGRPCSDHMLSAVSGQGNPMRIPCRCASTFSCPERQRLCRYPRQ
jgi:hypothetical protein